MNSTLGSYEFKVFEPLDKRYKEDRRRRNEIKRRHPGDEAGEGKEGMWASGREIMKGELGRDKGRGDRH